MNETGKIKFEKLNTYFYINDNDLLLEISDKMQFDEFFNDFIENMENVSRETYINLSDTYNDFIRENSNNNVSMFIYERNENGLIDIINYMFLINPENMNIFGIDLKNCELMF